MSDELILRKVKKTDEMLLFDWANDSETRKIFTKDGEYRVGEKFFQTDFSHFSLEEFLQY